MSSFTSVPVLKMHKRDKWEVFTPFTYYRDPILDKEGNVKDPKDYTEEERKLRTIETIVVPKGFITDLASIPRPLWIWFPPHDEYAKAAIIHDYMYDNGIGSKAEADYVFYEALGVLGIPNWKRKIMYRMVKWFGKGNYK